MGLPSSVTVSTPVVDPRRSRAWMVPPPPPRSQSLRWILIPPARGCEQQIHRVGEDVEELQIRAEWGSAVRRPPHRSEREIALDVTHRAERWQQLAEPSSRWFVQQLMSCTRWSARGSWRA